MIQQVVILRGPAGAGKSTIAELLKDKLGDTWAHLDIDKLKHAISKDSSKVRSLIAHNVGDYFLEQLLSNGFNVIAEEIFQEDYYKHVIELCKKQNARIHRFFISVPLEVLVQRDKDRETKNKGRDTIKELHELIKPLAEESILESAEHSKEDLVEMIMQEIRA